MNVVCFERTPEWSWWGPPCQMTTTITSCRLQRLRMWEVCLMFVETLMRNYRPSAKIKIRKAPRWAPHLKRRACTPKRLAKGDLWSFSHHRGYYYKRAACSSHRAATAEAGFAFLLDKHLLTLSLLNDLYMRHVFKRTGCGPRHICVIQLNMPGTDWRV